METARILALTALAMLLVWLLESCTPPPMQHNTRWYTPAEQVTAFLATRDYFIEMGHAFDEATEQAHRLHSIRVHVNCEAEK